MRARLVVLAVALAAAAVAVCVLRGPSAMPAFDVQRPDCETRAPLPIGGLTTLFVYETRGPGGSGIRIESNGRWERRVDYPPEQFAIPPDVTRGCVDPAVVRPFFEELAAEVTRDAGGAPASDAAMVRETEEGFYAVGPCTWSYAAGEADAGLPYQCSVPDLAARVVAAVGPGASAPASAPAACPEERCSFALEVGHVPHPHESGSTRIYELYRDGTYRCARDGDPLVGRVTNGEAVFEWLIQGATSRAPDAPTETFEPIALARVLGERGDVVGGVYPFDGALARWNAIAARIDPACVARSEP